MKILLINKYNYQKGGAETYFINFQEVLKSHGHEVAVFSMKDERNLPSKYEAYFSDRVDYNESKSSWKQKIKMAVNIVYNFQAAKNLDLLIKDFKPDLAHIHNVYHQLSPSVIMTLKKNNIPIVQTLHDYKLICPNYQLFNKGKICTKCQGKKFYNCFLGKCVKDSYLKSLIITLESYLHHRVLKTYRQVDLYIAPSQFMKDISVKFGIPKEKIVVINNFVEPEKIIFGGKEDGEAFILYFGRLSKEKGVDILINSMKDVKGATLKIIGNGPEEFELKLLAKRLNLETKIEFLGPKYGTQLMSYLKKAKAVVLPSIWYENMPLSMLEAMTASRVVIASRTGGMAEMINDKQNGFLFDLGNSIELSEIINSLDKYNLGAIGAKARERVLALNRDNHYYDVLNIYNNALHLNKMKNVKLSLPLKLSARNRKRKWKLFNENFEINKDTKIIDVGFAGKEYNVMENYLEKAYPYPENITAIGIDTPEVKYDKIKYVKYDGSALPFSDQCFDLAWSNATWEHVGAREKQVRFVKEIKRVAKNAFLTTPNKYFPIEIHTRIPFLHWLPKKIFDWILRAVGKDWATGDYLNLLSEKDIKDIMAEAGIKKYKIIKNKLFFFTIDFVVIF
jgi:glycosyltransferase involved in cell wall biosynthesis